MIMPVHDDLGKRMKCYEKVSRNYLVRRTPVIIRIDGKAHHSFTKGLKKPFDNIYIDAMNDTMLQLCQRIQGCVFGYCQSDEITLVLQDYATIKTDAWFEYNIQKLTSISASMATLYFNKAFDNRIDEYIGYLCLLDDEMKDWVFSQEEKYIKNIEKKCIEGALFDARAFNLPKDEVVNCIYWRQLDAIRNSIQMCGHTYFSHKELENKSCEDIKQMLEEIGQPWENLSFAYQRGRACYRDENQKWIIDKHMPVLKGEERDYLERLI